MVRVIDTSVAIKWFVLERGSNKALQLLSDLLNAPSDFAVPELFYFELVHVFNRVIPEPEEVQLGLLAKVSILGIQRFTMTPSLISEIRGFQQLGLSGYDAAYVGLAKLLEGKWVTCDKKAHALVAHLKLSEIL